MEGELVEFTILNEVDRQRALRMVDNAPIGTSVVFKSREMTKSQKGAMYVWFREMAKALNEAGYDMQTVLSQAKCSIPWTKESFKESIWKPVLSAQAVKGSTEKQQTTDVMAVHNTLARFFSEKFGVYVPWPNKRG